MLDNLSQIQITELKYSAAIKIEDVLKETRKEKRIFNYDYDFLLLRNKKFDI